MTVNRHDQLGFTFADVRLQELAPCDSQLRCDTTELAVQRYQVAASVFCSTVSRMPCSHAILAASDTFLVNRHHVPHDTHHFYVGGSYGAIGSTFQFLPEESHVGVRGDILSAGKELHRDSQLLVSSRQLEGIDDAVVRYVHLYGGIEFDERLS